MWRQSNHGWRLPRQARKNCCRPNSQAATFVDHKGGEAYRRRWAPCWAAQDHRPAPPARRQRRSAIFAVSCISTAESKGSFTFFQTFAAITSKANARHRQRVQHLKRRQQRAKPRRFRHHKAKSRRTGCKRDTGWAATGWRANRTAKSSSNSTSAAGRSYLLHPLRMQFAQHANHHAVQQRRPCDPDRNAGWLAGTPPRRTQQRFTSALTS